MHVVKFTLYKKWSALTSLFLCSRYSTCRTPDHTYQQDTAPLATIKKAAVGNRMLNCTHI